MEQEPEKKKRTFDPNTPGNRLKAAQAKMRAAIAALADQGRRMERLREALEEAKVRHEALSVALAQAEQAEQMIREEVRRGG